MPNFLEALRQGQARDLMRVVEAQLATSGPGGTPPPINDVFRAFFSAANRSASGPSEPGAGTGELCAPAGLAPPRASANSLCEFRRSLDLLVHQGRGIAVMDQVEPQLRLSLNYLTGRGLDCRGRPRAPHYEVTAAAAQFCGQTANCQLKDGLDLAIALTDYLNTAKGQALITDFNVLRSKASVRGLLDPLSLTESDAVNIVRTIVTALQGANGSALRRAINTLPLNETLKADLQPLVGDVEGLFEQQAIMAPLHRVIHCVTTADRNFDFARMYYRLAVEEGCPEFDFSRLTSTLQGVHETDSCGSLLFLLGSLARAIRADDFATSSVATVCRTVLSTSNAPEALPSLASLVEKGVINEGLTALDTLLFCRNDMSSTDDNARLCR